MKDKNISIETMLSHYAEDRDSYYGAVVSPIYQTSLFTFDSMKSISEAFDDEQASYLYTRGNNPTAKIAEDKIAYMENAESAKLFSSGMGAISSAILSCVKAGEHIVAIETVYGPTISLLSEYLSKRLNIKTTFVKADEKEIINAVQENTTLIYLESPTSLVFEIIDLKCIADFAKSKGIKTIIDNSWATPIYQKPLDYGIDIVVHSVSKYLAGHSDLVAGVVASNTETIMRILKYEHALFGAKIAPIEAWLILRGLRTLPIRLRQHSESAMKIARFLENHKKYVKLITQDLPHMKSMNLLKSK